IYCGKREKRPKCGGDALIKFLILKGNYLTRCGEVRILTINSREESVSTRRGGALFLPMVLTRLPRERGLAAMAYTKEEIIRKVQEEDIEFIRLQFTDIFGQLKNVAITASQIEK